MNHTNHDTTDRQDSHGTLLQHLDVEYAPYELDVMNSNIRQRHKAQQRNMALVALSILLLVGLFAGSLFWNPTNSSSSAPSPSRENIIEERFSKLVALQDGSSISTNNPNTTWEIHTETSTRTSVHLTDGMATFTVSPSKTRVFEVKHGPVTVTVLGTIFEVHARKKATYVRVMKGRVRVANQHGVEKILTKQQDFELRWKDGKQTVSIPKDIVNIPKKPDIKHERPRPTVAKGTTPHKPRRNSRTRPAPSSSSSWKQLNQQGDYAQAAKLLLSQREHPRHTVEELLLAADLMRLTKKHKQSARYLDILLRKHPSDVQAPMAMFLKAKLLLGPLKKPGRAATLFERARYSAKQRVLREDAHARQVEALHRAGNKTQAREVATEYIKTYPKGARIRAVRTFGGLE